LGVVSGLFLTFVGPTGGVATGAAADPPKKLRMALLACLKFFPNNNPGCMAISLLLSIL
jgi:hypothetical protein